MALEAYFIRDYALSEQLVDGNHYVQNKSSIVASIVRDSLTNRLYDADATEFILRMMILHPIKPIIKSVFMHYLIMQDRKAIRYFTQNELFTEKDILQLLGTLELFYDPKYSIEQTSNCISLLHWLL
jgi:hypothetical protein